MQHYDCLIVGTGHGGSQAAIMLRKRNYQGSIALLGEECDLPYERPPLSKDYLAGTKPFDRLLIQPKEQWEAKNIALLLGRRVDSVDPSAHRVTLCRRDLLRVRHPRLGRRRQAPDDLSPRS